MRWLVRIVLAFYAFVLVSLVVYRFVDPPLTAVQAENFVFGLFAGRHEPFEQTDIPLSSVPVVMQHAVIAAEDGAFYQHHGIDWAELNLVLDKASDGGRLRGASTITQQLVKNLYLTNSRLPLRKLVEYTLAPLAEIILGKQRILEIYLNVIEWGPNVWGVEAAARHHYGISAKQLSRDQAARLAACIPSPRKRTPPQMNKYSAIILDRMQSRGW
ncbi:MAG: monofunctional biosynthetic peptidoglycan transglycosylase [Bryobacterales bacterium]